MSKMSSLVSAARRPCTAGLPATTTDAPPHVRMPAVAGRPPPLQLHTLLAAALMARL